MSEVMTSYGKHDVDFSRQLGAAGSQIDGLDTRIKHLEDSDVKIKKDISVAQADIETIKTRLGTVEKVAEENRVNVGKLNDESAEKKGYWKGIKDSAKIAQWASGILFAGAGALIMFLLQKVFTP